MTPMSAREVLETDVPLGVLMQARLAARHRRQLPADGGCGSRERQAAACGRRLRPGTTDGPARELPGRAIARVLQVAREGRPQAAEPSLAALPADVDVEVVELSDDSVLVAVAVDPPSLAPPAGSVAEEPLLRESVR